MSRKVRDDRLDNRTGRLRLPIRREPYFRSFQLGRAIGYRRLPGKSGSWIARHYDKHRDPARLYRALGFADDYLDANGRDVLTFAQAQEAAGAWFAALAANPAPEQAPVTVAEAADLYLAHYRARGGKAEEGTHRTIATHILPAFGNRAVADLTTAVIRAWHAGLATSPARMRSGKREDAHQNVRAAEDDAARRARRSTANRVLTTLKAILNHAWHDGRVPTDDAWRRVRPFAHAEAARVRYLTDDEAVRLVNATDPGFRPMVLAGLLTGARYGELCALRVADVDLGAGTALIRESKSGRPRAVVLTDEAARLFAQHLAGKAPSDLVFTRPDGAAWAKSHQGRPLDLACRAAGIAPIGFHVLRHTFASRLAMRGVALGVIAAQLGHSEAICAKHYRHLAPDFVAEAVRAGAGDLGIVPEMNIAALRR
ncbi:MAG: site-specific integrase [Rhodospirillales bacterium]|nr:site-specific integrase [Rhodospirillales bacterium]